MMTQNDNILIDRTSYNKIWSILVKPTMEDYSNRFSEIVIVHNAQEVIWQEYIKFNEHCNLQYMQDVYGKLDRHKVCACYMYAIVKANVMSCKLADSNTEKSYLALNENLAITVGMSLLRAFVLTSIESSDYLTIDEKNYIVQELKMVFCFQNVIMEFIGKILHQSYIIPI